MQWIKDKVGGTNNGAPDKQNFIVGSDKWIGSSQNPNSQPPPMAPLGSLQNSESAQNAVQTYNFQSNPYVQQPQEAQALDKNKNGSPAENPRNPGMYPNIYDDGQQQDSNNAGSYEDVLTGSQALVTIPGAVVHLIDDEESVHLATGEFSLVRLVQEKTQVVVFAKVGKDLKWPLVKQEPTVKLDPTHYFFSLKIPKDKDDHHASSPNSETLNYGLTFPAESSDKQTAMIHDLDYFLERYSMFSAPDLVQGDAREGSKEAEAAGKLHTQDPSFPGKDIPADIVSGDGKVMADEESSAAFWTTIAPNVNDYNSKLAKWIATGAGHIIKEIFWLSDATVAQVDSGHGFMKAKFNPKKAKSTISPAAIGGVRSVRKLSGMTDKVAGGVLGGVLYTTGLLSSAVVNSPPGKMFFKTTPGEVVLVSLDAFGTVFDAIEKAGTDVMVRSSTVTQDFVNYRYGESAKELTDESLRSVGHAASIAWTLTKIRKAFNPKALVSKTGVAKSLGKSALVSNKKTGDETKE